MEAGGRAQTNSGSKRSNEAKDLMKKLRGTTTRTSEDEKELAELAKLIYNKKLEISDNL